jgi:hypothetical protein
MVDRLQLPGRWDTVTSMIVWITILLRSLAADVVVCHFLYLLLDVDLALVQTLRNKV